jgi:hypothetical protein
MEEPKDSWAVTLVKGDFMKKPGFIMHLASSSLVKTLNYPLAASLWLWRDTTGRSNYLAMGRYYPQISRNF